MNAVFFPTNEALQGLAILTRFPIVSFQNVPLTSLGKQTGVQFVRLRAPDGGALDVYNTELGYLLRDNAQTISAQEQDQTTQLSEIFTLIGQNDPDPKTRVVVGGTFNNTPASDLYGHMAAAFVDPFAGIAQEKTQTWRLVNNVTSRVDYLWLRGITPLSAAVADLTESTHGMAVVEIALK
jgi:endonuclease/exonuclease/phosphatase family metal-dependent hydrolase